MTGLVTAWLSTHVGVRESNDLGFFSSLRSMIIPTVAARTLRQRIERHSNESAAINRSPAPLENTGKIHHQTGTRTVSGG